VTKNRFSGKKTLCLQNAIVTNCLHCRPIEYDEQYVTDAVGIS